MYNSGKGKYIVISLRSVWPRLWPQDIARWALGALLLAHFGVMVAARAADQRLILTDGTDQLVRSYEIIGDRVRYLSAERMDWEEIPRELIDWPATEAAQRAAEQAAEEARAKAVQVQPRVIAPGVLMPDREGIYVFTSASLTKLNQAQAIIENDKKRSLLSMITPVPIVKGKAHILLPGKQAQAAVRGSPSAVYIMLSPAAPDAATGAKPSDSNGGKSAQSRGAAKPSAAQQAQSSANGGNLFALVRLRAKGNERQVGEISFSPLGGAMNESRDLIAASFELAFPAQTNADGDSLSVVWKLVPQAPLAPGEYAVIEFVDHQRQNLFVWDFRVTAASEPRQ